MKAITRLLFLDENNEKFFGEGPYRLLKEVEKSGSLRSAASSMGMAYTKAFKMIKTAEQALGFPLTHRVVGGKSGGGSSLTEEGKKWLLQYEAYRDECYLVNQQLYQKHFGEIKNGNK